MNSNAYDPSDSSTWKNRFTRNGLQWDGLANTGRIVIPVISIIFFSLTSTIIYIAQDQSNIKVKLILVVLTPLIFAIGIKYTFMQANTFAKKFYQLPNDYSTNQLIRHKLFIPPPLPNSVEKIAAFPYIMFKKVEDFDQNHRAYWFGGPALLIIYDGLAVYVERGNKFSRVLGPGLPAPVLEHYEKIKAVVDLRPKIKEGVVEAWTKDGVQVKANVQAEVQIFSSEEAKKRSVILEEGQDATNLVYPYDANSVKKVVEGIAVGIDNETKELFEKIWHDAAIGSITGSIKAYISRHSLNELITGDESSPQLLSFQISDKLSSELENGLRNNNGVQLLDLQITGFTPADEEIKEKLEEYWEEKEKQTETIRKGNAKAQNIRIKQNAYTVAYQDFLNMRIDQLRETDQDNNRVDIENSTEATLMLLTQMFSESSSDPLQGSLIAREMLTTLNILREQLNS